MRYLLSILFLFLCSYCPGQSISKDLHAQQLIKEGIDHMYNFEFDDAEKKFLKIKTKYPDHPAYYLLTANNENWKILYNNSFKEQSEVYYNKLKVALKYAEKLAEKNKKDPEATFFLLASHSSLSFYFNQKDDYIKTMNEARKAYSYMKDGFGLKDKNNEFYFTTGLYNYYVIRYPESRPLVKPFMIFFAGGNIQDGINQLIYASEHGVFTKTEAQYYLVNIFLKYENTPKRALEYSAKLIEKYPKNLFFLTRHAEALTLAGDYEEAEKISRELKKCGNKFFEMAGNVFMGIIKEKYYHKEDLAKNYYLYALKLSEQVENPATDYISFTYAGLGRIYAAKGERGKAVEYYKKCLKHAQYTAVKKEAEEYLDKND